MRPQPPDAPGLATYASDPARSRGRLHAEPESPTRTAFQRDRDRIIHSGAFRKLQYKTQVFVYHEGDYYRTRLTHSLEVAQIARSVARQLGLDEDLSEAVALAHDLGHTPFGHAGEYALQAAMAPFGGFDHNEQTLRIVTRLEARYAAFDGLNLTWETLEGVAKHNGPVAQPRPTLTALDRAMRLGIDSFPGPEAQLAALADDIAYVNHDVDDGLRAGLFSMDALRDLPLLGPTLLEVDRRHPDLEPARRTHELIRRVINLMVVDLVAETRRRLAEAAPADVEAVRALGRPVVAFSEALQRDIEVVRAFLFRRMYRHYRVNRVTSKARRVLRQLFDLYMAEPNCLPDGWQEQVLAEGEPAQQARIVADYLAGMTDRYALESHEKLFNPAIRL